MARLLPAVATTIVTLCSSLGFAQAPNVQIRVRLDISCAQCADTVRSYLSRELRKFADVAITDDSPQYELWVVVTETRTHSQGSQPIAYAMAYLFVDKAMRDMIVSIIELAMPQCAGAGGKALAMQASNIQKNLMAVGNLRLRVFPAEALEAQCREVIAEFDGSELEGHRSLIQYATEILDKARTPTPVQPH